jgi:hypothetical protein
VRLCSCRYIARVWMLARTRARETAVISSLLLDPFKHPVRAPDTASEHKIENLDCGISTQKPRCASFPRHAPVKEDGFFTQSSDYDDHRRQTACSLLPTASFGRWENVGELVRAFDSFGKTLDRDARAYVDYSTLFILSKWL